MDELERNTDGFRLKRVEVYNWGTFHKKVWKLELGGQNGLLTGEIGSGKSTLVDAISCLLVPAQKIVFNKAAGATSKERDLRSYVMGYYKSQTSEYGNSRPIALRPNHNEYSVVLAVFHNEQLQKAGHEGYEVTLAQVFFMTNTQNQPEKMFVTAETGLSIRDSFADFGHDPKDLRRKLRQKKAEIFDSFTQYAAWWKRRFGLNDNDQAIDLFAQTVSMKTVDNISSFVQAHMLQKVEADEKIEEIIDRFNDLNTTYENVCRARNMLELLSPMKETALLVNALNQELRRLALAKEELDVFIDLQVEKILTGVIQGERQDLEKIRSKLEEFSLHEQALEKDLEQSKEDRRKNGGEQLESLQHQIRMQEENIRSRKERSSNYERLLKLLGMNLPRSINGFVEQKSVLRQKARELESSQDDLQLTLIKNGSQREQISAEISRLTEDIRFIGEHPSNISISQLKIRETICADLGLDPRQMPFVGELIEIREQERERWEGAIERVLHGFALSLLVPELYYTRVMNYVDTHDLKGRLIYYRVKEDTRYTGKAPYPDELRSKLNLKDQGELTEFVRQQLDDNFAYICCEDYEQFRREKKALTPNGQIKSGHRHEKDDRNRLHDRTHYVLGWSNTDKLMILSKSLYELKSELVRLDQQWEDINVRNRELQNSGKVLARVEDYKNYEEIDYLSLNETLKVLQEEYQRIESGSDIFKLLNAKIDKIQGELRALHEENNALMLKRGGLEESLVKHEQEYDQLQAELAAANQQLSSLSLLNELQAKALEGKALTLAQCPRLNRDLNKELDKLANNTSAKASTQEKKLIAAMTDFNHKYEVESSEMDASIESWPQYNELLDRIISDDLPRFESLFKKKLKNNTLNDVATLNAFLDTSSSDITKRISVINSALKTIEYNPGRHIQLVAINTEDQEIRQFRHDLREMIDNRSEIDTASLEISEERFKRVKDLIERFKGRADSVEADRRWRSKVTDVRRWYEFAAQELYDADDSQYEYYKDSSGKSGGQKEKLAYTILATSLAYQFGTGLSQAANERSFRFVIIDEAFGRGSDDSASFGLRLFQKLKLQLLVVTPMQKISIIEPYVEHVAMVSKNETTSESSIRNLTIEEYRLLKKQHELLQNTVAADEKPVSVDNVTL